MDKILPKATGPYSFIKYKGKLRATAIIRAKDGRTLEVAAGHLLPVAGGSTMREATGDMKDDGEDQGTTRS